MVATMRGDGMCGSLMSTGTLAPGGLLWLLPGMLTLVLLTVGAILLAARRQPRPVAPADEPTALAVLKERYARGEIDHAQLTRMLDTLLRNEQRPGPGH
jgi:uncharacterized membrane protein